ncbi:transposase [candidate division FCPU426 bacterium]|nr:transposase [candidate division FCPU426 bacterium]
MKYSPQIHQRRSIRLKGYDYSKAGAYVVTICTQNRECLFGNIEEGEMRLNDAGQMVQKVWDEIPVYYGSINIDEFVIMPNHIHGIIKIDGADPHKNIVGAGPCACPIESKKTREGQPQGVAPTDLSLPDVVHRFKTMTTKKYTDGVKQHDWPSFSGRLWQRNYWEHIIRDEPELNRVREYITNNPGKWELDNLFVL